MSYQHTNKILLLAFVLMCFSLQGKTQNLKLAPYLQNPAPDAVTVMWQTNDRSYSWVEYGTDINDLQIARSVENGIVTANVTKHKVRLKDLQPDTKYFYRICTREVLEYKAYSKTLGEKEQTDFYSFTTLGPEPENFTCLVFNDLHDRLDVFDKLMRQIDSRNIEFDFSIFNGDNFNDPTSEGQILNLVRHFNNGIDASNKYAFYLRGNHEIRGPYALQWPSFFDFDEDKTYSAFSYGDTRFILLDNGEDKSDGSVEYSGLVDFDGFRNEQTEWLKSEVTSSEFKTAFRRILVHHIPIYGWNNSWDPGFIPCFDLWDPIFKSNSFDIDITGHLHRFSFHSKNTVNNPFPQVVGGGNNETSARVLVLEKREEALTLKSIDCEGNMQVFPIHTQDVSLESVFVEGGILEPEFKPDHTDYKILVPKHISTITLIGEASGSTAVVKGNITNKVCTIGENIILKVETEDGTSKSYTFKVTLNTASAASYGKNKEIKIYPTILEQGSQLFIDLDKYYSDVVIRIYDVQGKEAFVEKLQSDRINLPLSLKQGTYFISFDVGDKIITDKFLIK